MRYILFILLTLLNANISNAWEQRIDFESGVGLSDGISYAGTLFTQSDTISQKGAYSAKIHFPAGDTCWDAQMTCGAYLYMPSTVGVGQGLWTRMYVYFPVGWDWGDQAGTGQWRKILRYGIRTPPTTSRGRIEVGGVWSGGSSTTCEIVGNTEAGNHYDYYDQLTGINFPVGRWFSIEQYVKFGTTDETTRHIIWLDGKLIFDSKNLASNNPVLGSVNDYANEAFIFTYWNGRVRTTQDAFVDNIVMTTDEPTKKDAFGNSMIGPDNNLPIFNHLRIKANGKVLRWVEQ